jgi:hypothetical protein
MRDANREFSNVNHNDMARWGKVMRSLEQNKSIAGEGQSPSNTGFCLFENAW